MKNFISEDQSIMSSAKNYNKYLFSLVRPYIKDKVIEIGSGIGNITKQIVESQLKVSKLYCIEPDETCITLLKETTSNSSIPISFIRGNFPERNPEKNNFTDLIFSFNVFEHIENDIEAFRTSYNLLKKDGIFFCFVPAFECLYGSMDKELCHFRRYTKSKIQAKLESCGFKTIECKYSNFTGFFAWFINNRIFKIKSQNKGQVQIFDKILLPIQSFLERYISFPLGQNVYIIAQKK